MQLVNLGLTSIGVVSLMEYQSIIMLLRTIFVMVIGKSQRKGIRAFPADIHHGNLQA